MECYFPKIDGFVAVDFLTVVPGDFGRIRWSREERFGVFVGIEMKSPFEVTWTLPELYGVVEIRIEELSQLNENSCRVELVGVGFTVKDLLSGVNGIGYDYDLGYAINGIGLVDTTPDCEQFGFSACYKQSVVDCLGERTIRYVDVQDRCSNVVFDASIHYYECRLGQGEVAQNHVV